MKSLTSMEIICSTSSQTLADILFDYFIPVNHNIFINRILVGQIVADQLPLEDQVCLNNPNVKNYRDYPKATIEDIWNFTVDQLKEYKKRHSLDHKTYNEIRTAIAWWLYLLGRLEQSDKQYLNSNFSVFKFPTIGDVDALSQKRRDYTVNILGTKFDEIYLASEVVQYDKSQRVAIIVYADIEIRDSNSLELLNGLILDQDVDPLTFSGDRLFYKGVDEDNIYYWDLSTNSQQLFITTSPESTEFVEQKYLSVFSRPHLKIYDLETLELVVDTKIAEHEAVSFVFIYSRVGDMTELLNALSGKALLMPSTFTNKDRINVELYYASIITKTSIEIYDPSTFKLLQTIEIPNIDFYQVDIQGNRLLLRAETKIYIYNLTTFELLHITDHLSDWESPFMFQGKLYSYYGGELVILDLTTFQRSVISYNLLWQSMAIFE
jgi:hypothetical protein